MAAAAALSPRPAAPGTRPAPLAARRVCLLSAQLHLMESGPGRHRKFLHCPLHTLPPPGAAVGTAPRLPGGGGGAAPDGDAPTAPPGSPPARAGSRGACGGRGRRARGAPGGPGHVPGVCQVCAPAWQRGEGGRARGALGARCPDVSRWDRPSLWHRRGDPVISGLRWFPDAIWTGRNGCKQKEAKIRLSAWKFFHVGVMGHWNRLPREVWMPQPWWWSKPAWIGL